MHTQKARALQSSNLILRTSILTVITLCSLASFAQEENSVPVKLRIMGEIDPNSQTSSLWILRQNDTPHNPTAEVPIVDYKIDFVFETSQPDLFYFISVQDLCEKGTCMPMYFFAENGELYLTGKDNEDDDSKCLKLNIEKTSSPLNNRLIQHNQYRQQNYYSKTDSISAQFQNFSEEEYYSAQGRTFWQEFNALMEKISEYPDSFPLLQQRNDMYNRRDAMEKDRTMYSEKYYQLYDQFKTLNNDMLNAEIETFGSADGDFFAMSILSDDFFKTYDNDTIKEKIIDVYKRNFQERFSNTLMGRRLNEAITGYEINHIGGNYPDYQLPDADGNLHNVKDLINGRVVLIDLWGSTCSPCRINSRSMIPVYNEFKEKGFDIIGIAREYQDLSRFHSAVEKDGYPWMQLIELDDSSGIFNVHGIPNAMGGTYLVGPENIGQMKEDKISDKTSDKIKVLMINPTAEELREFLSQYYASQKL